ncbi:MAG: hypothetical protein AB3N33_03035 [Puniceicoccaceae bacterium]
MKNLTLLCLSLLTAVSVTAQTIVFQDAFDGTVPTYDSPNDGGAALVVDGSAPFSPVYYDGNDASVAPGTWQFSGVNFEDDMTLSQNQGRARAATIVLSGPVSGTMTVSFDLIEVGPGDTLYVGVYDAFNSTGDTTNAYGYDVLANFDPPPPSVALATDWAAVRVDALWGPVALGDATVTELELFSVGGAEDNSALAGTAQSFTFTPGANDVMLFVGVSSLTNEGVRASLDNLTITSGDGGGGTTWAGYSVDEQGWTDTTPWLGWINVSQGDYIWSISLNKYIYMPEGFVSESGAWSYVPGN